MPDRALQTCPGEQGNDQQTLSGPAKGLKLHSIIAHVTLHPSQLRNQCALSGAALKGTAKDETISDFKLKRKYK